MDFHGYEPPKQALGNRFAASCGLLYPCFAGYPHVLCTRDNSTYRYYCASLVISEFH
jgi:hypothetical protein